MNIKTKYRPGVDDTFNRWPCLLVVAALTFAPLYVFSSGGPQPVDLLIVSIVIYVVLSLTYAEIHGFATIALALAAFILWAVSINFYYFIVLQETRFLKSSTHLIYDMVLFLAFIVIFSRMLMDNRSRPYLYSAVLAGTLTPFFANGIPSLDFTTRQSLSFNDPNQLADFALIMMTMVFILNHYYSHLNRRHHRTAVALVTLIIFMAGHLYILLSASRAGLGGLVVLDAIMIWKLKKKIGILLIPLAVTAIIVAGIQLNRDSSSQDRFSLGHSLIGSRMDIDLLAALEKRASGRLGFEDLSVIFGIGKCSGCSGKKAGQNTFEVQREAHNTLVDVVYSYGLIGLVLFSIFLFHYFKVAFRTLFFVPLFIAFVPANLSQNLIRFRSVWIFYALAYAVSRLNTVRCTGEADQRVDAKDTAPSDMSKRPSPFGSAPARN